ncbi:PIR protein [Plasmodium vivax]|uniref:VIR protein n=1 Tax=Plasmodium vivax TaxID=5855 RepID=A0A565A4M3_PLAVI|nr:PIR protein [Plasmodium vivax]
MSGQQINYGIFEDTDTLDRFEYIKTQIEGSYKKANNSDFCIYITSNSRYGDQLKDFCRMIVALFNASTRQKKDSFYSQVKREYSLFKADDKLKNRMYVINDKYLINLHILYKLYENYDKLNQEKETYYDKFLEEMISQYNYGLEKCFYDGDINFCNALKNFKDYYEKDKKSMSKFCKDDDNKCPKLPEITLTSKSNNKQLRIAIIGNELFRRSYNPTLNKYSLDKPEEYYNLKDLTFVHYNLRMEKDEENKKCAMMKILYQFIEYCSKNKDDLKLSLFMKEFIKEYYNEKQSEYQGIFEECSPNAKSEKHCQLYKKCNDEYKSEFTLMVKNSAEYIKQQEEYIENLSSLGLLILKAKDMFRDSEAMSRYSTTIISILISFILCLFFLYKLTPLSSIFRKEKKRKKIPLFFPERRVQDVKDDDNRHKNVKTKRGKIRFAYQQT